MEGGASHRERWNDGVAKEQEKEGEGERESKEEMREARGGLRKAKLPPSAYVDRLLSCSILAAIQSEAKMSLSLSLRTFCALRCYSDARPAPKSNATLGESSQKQHC